MAIASATKLLTTIAVLQIVERGLIGLDDELSGVIPLLEKQGVLHGLGGEGPAVYEERQNPLTLRWVRSPIMLRDIIKSYVGSFSRIVPARHILP